MGCCKSKTATKKPPSKSCHTRTGTRATSNGQPTTSLRSCSQIVTRAASNERPITSLRDTVTNTARRTSTKYHDDSAGKPPVSNRLGLRRNDIPKIMKLLMNAANFDDTDHGTDRTEAPIMEETKLSHRSCKTTYVCRATYVIGQQSYQCSPNPSFRTHPDIIHNTPGNFQHCSHYYQGLHFCHPAHACLSRTTHRV